MKHTLHEQIVIVKMLELLELHASDIVLNVAAGGGEIVSRLVTTPVHQVIAVESDRNFAPRLLAMLQQHPHRLSVVFGDALRVLKSEPCNKVVGVLPTEAVLVLLAQNTVERAVFILLENDAKQIPSTLYSVTQVSSIPKDAFTPPLAHDAVLVLFTRR